VSGVLRTGSRTDALKPPHSLTFVQPSLISGAAQSHVRVIGAVPGCGVGAGFDDESVDSTEALSCVRSEVHGL